MKLTDTGSEPAFCDKRRRLSVEDISGRLAIKGLALVGKYLGTTKSHCIVRCNEGHEWNALIDNVIKKNSTGCPHCSGRAQLTIEEVRKRLAPKKITMLGENPRVAKHAKFECERGHIWVARLSTVMSETSCPYCRTNKPLTIEEVNSRIADRGYSVVGPYINAGQRTTFACSNGHTWAAIPDNILRGKGCPSCAEYGFNPKYPTFFYTIHIASKDEDYVGFGITKDIDTRFSYHVRAIKRKGFNHRLLDLYIFDSGHDAKTLEDLVKENFTLVDTGIPGFRKEAILGDHYPRLVDMMWTLGSVS